MLQGTASQEHGDIDTSRDCISRASNISIVNNGLREGLPQGSMNCKTVDLQSGEEVNPRIHSRDLINMDRVLCWILSPG